MPKNRLLDHWISNNNFKRGKKFFRLKLYWWVSTADQQSAPNSIASWVIISATTGFWESRKQNVAEITSFSYVNFETLQLRENR